MAGGGVGAAAPGKGETIRGKCNNSRLQIPTIRFKDTNHGGARLRAREPSRKSSFRRRRADRPRTLAPPEDKCPSLPSYSHFGGGGGKHPVAGGAGGVAGPLLPDLILLPLSLCCISISLNPSSPSSLSCSALPPPSSFYAKNFPFFFNLPLCSTFAPPPYPPLI